MKLIVCHSLDPDTAEAARELIEAARVQLRERRPAAGMLYVAMDIDHNLLAGLLREAFPELVIIGCSTDGEISSTCGFHEDSTILILFASERITIRAGLGRHASADPDAAARAAIEMARQPGDPPPRLCIALPDGLSVSGSVITDALQEVLGVGVPLVGGTAGDQRQFSACRMLFGGELLEDAVVLLLFSGPLQIGVGVDSGWSPIGQTSRVTASQNNIVSRIGEQTALAFYQSYIGRHVIPDPEYPLALHDPDRAGFSLRAPLIVDEASGTIQFAGDVPVGSIIQITEASHEDILDACAQSVRAAFRDLGPHTPDGALVFSCAARRMVLGTQTTRELKTLQANADTELPIAGFYTYGEIAALRRGEPARFHNETFVTLLLAEL